MLLQQKLVDETQISKPQDHTDTFKQNLPSIFLSVMPKLLLTFQYEIPCTYNACISNNNCLDPWGRISTAESVKSKKK